MWVWIPRYAYKITEGYHTNTTGTIEIAFINTSNEFLNSSDTGVITTNPAEEGAGITKWLVHPAFTANAANGGGFGELSGIWVGKFEATGTNTNLSVKPGLLSLRDMTINEQYQLAKSSNFGEAENLNSHMTKNSEWGAITYLTHSKYGIDGQNIEGNNEIYISGRSTNKAVIYTINKKQSTTHNATGIYDMIGGLEHLAAYVNGSSSNLSTNGGVNSGDLYGANSEEQSTSTSYKTVYKSSNNQSADYETAKEYKGDAVYETSNSHYNETGAWLESFTYFPTGDTGPFFIRGVMNKGLFSFSNSNGWAENYRIAFRPVLAF